MWYVLSRSLLLPAVNLIRQSLCADLVLAFGFYFQARRSDRAAQGLRYGCCVRYPCRSSRFWTLQLPRTPSTIPAPTLCFAHLLPQSLIFLSFSFPPFPPSLSLPLFPSLSFPSVHHHPTSLPLLRIHRQLSRRTHHPARLWRPLPQRAHPRRRQDRRLRRAGLWSHPQPKGDPDPVLEALQRRPGGPRGQDGPGCLSQRVTEGGIDVYEGEGKPRVSFVSRVETWL
jgi:hypothetical protein